MIKKPSDMPRHELEARVVELEALLSEQERRWAARLQLLEARLAHIASAALGGFDAWFSAAQALDKPKAAEPCGTGGPGP